MKSATKILSLLLLIITANTTYAGSAIRFPFAGSMVELLDSTMAAMINGKPDDYTKALTPFDLQIRLDIINGAKEKDYLAKAAAQVRSWSGEEQEALKQSFKEIEAFLKKNNIRLNLPVTIQLIKTAGKEEFGAEGYTRQNRIILCTGERQPVTTHLVAHELFHVYSRFNEEKRSEIYDIFGFKKCNRINTTAAMNNRVITNPDCPFIEHYITLDVAGNSMDMVLQLYSGIGYKENGNLGDYMNVGLLEVSGTDADKKPVMKNGSGIVYQVDQVPDLLSKISRNTPYVLHPEEISAEHFAMWVIGEQVPQPEFFERLKKILQQ